METEKYFEQIVSGEGLSYEDKLGIIKEMVHWKIFKAIQEHTVIAKATGENILFQVTTGETDNYNLGTERLLKIIGATDIKVSSKTDSGKDMGGRDESWRTTKIQFKI